MFAAFTIVDTAWLKRGPPPAPMAHLGPDKNHACEYNRVPLLLNGSVCVMCGTKSDWACV